MPVIRFTRPKKKKAEEGDGQSNGNNRMISRVAWVLLSLAFLGAMLLDAFFSEKGILRVQELEETYKSKLAEEAEKFRETEDLKEKIQALRNDPKAVEGVAREELGMVKPGEDVFLFAKEPEVVLPAPAEEEKAKPTK